MWAGTGKFWNVGWGDVSSLPGGVASVPEKESRDHAHCTVKFLTEESPSWSLARKIERTALLEWSCILHYN